MFYLMRIIPWEDCSGQRNSRLCRSFPTPPARNSLTNDPRGHTAPRPQVLLQATLHEDKLPSHNTGILFLHNNNKCAAHTMQESSRFQQLANNVYPDHICSFPRPVCHCAWNNPAAP